MWVSKIMQAQVDIDANTSKCVGRYDLRQILVELLFIKETTYIHVHDQTQHSNRITCVKRS